MALSQLRPKSPQAPAGGSKKKAAGAPPGGAGGGQAGGGRAARGNQFVQDMMAQGAGQSPEATLQALGEGRPLDRGTATRLGAGAADVRVHDDEAAHALTASLHARAFTVGTHIAFAAGRYRPGTAEGDALIQHELAHTVQQQGATQEASGPTAQSARHDAFEQQADGAAAGTEKASAGSAGGLRIQKKGEIEATEEAVGQRVVDNMDQANSGGNADSGCHYAHNYKRQYPDRWKEEYRKGTSDPAYFKVNGFMDFRLEDKKSASAGIKKFMKGLTICECLTLIVAIQVDSMRAAMGDDKFDENFGMEGKSMGEDRRLRISTNVRSTPLGRVIKQADATGKGEIGTIGNRPNVKPGEWYYFYNHPKYLLKHPGGAWQGENAIFVGERGGEQVWSGFGASNVTEDHMMDQMVSSYAAARTEYDYQVLCETYMSDLDEVKKGTVSSWSRLYEVHKDKVPELYREGGEFPDAVDKKEIIDAPAYAIGSTTRKGGFMLDAGSAIDVGKLQALAK